MNHSKLPKLLLAICLIWVIAACRMQGTPTPVVPDDSLLSQRPCSPPCWQGLTPGVTSYEEAYRFVQDNPLVNGNVDTRGGERPLVWWWAGENHDPRRSNTFGIDSNHIVEQIIVHPNTDISMRDVLRTYATPTFLQMRVHQQYGLLDDIPDGIWITAYYVPHNLEVSWFIETQIKNPMQFCPSLATSATEITFNTPKITESDQADLLSKVSRGNLVLTGDSIVHIMDGKVTIDCVEIKW